MTRAGSSVRKSLDSRDCFSSVGSGGGEDGVDGEGEDEMSEEMGVTRARTARSRRRRR